MNTHDKYELPPPPEWLGWPVTVSEMTTSEIKEAMQDYALSAIEPYAKRIAELESQLEAIGAGGVTQGQRLIEADRKRRGELVAWENFPGYLIDKCEGETITEEGLQRALADMLADPYYAPQPADPNEWKQAVDNELTSIHSTADSFPSAKEAVKALVDWHVAVATDPVFHPAEPVKVPSDEDILETLESHGALVTQNSLNAVRALLDRYGQTSSTTKQRSTSA